MNPELGVVGLAVFALTVGLLVDEYLARRRRRCRT